MAKKRHSLEDHSAVNVTSGGQTKTLAEWVGSSSDAVAVKTSATPPAAPALYYWKCADVAFSLPAGTYTGTQSVTLSGGEGETIRFTTNGDDPTSDSTEATGPISVAASATVKARGFKADTAPGDVASAAYVIEAAPPGQTAQPTLDAIVTPTNDDPIAIGGTCESGASVQPFVDGVAHGTPVTATGASWTANLSGVAAGSRSITVTATAAGKTESAASAARTIVVDRTAPSAPTITSPAAGTTTDATTSIVFTGEAGGTGKAYVGATEYAATESPAGTYTATGCALTLGANSLTAKITDAAGNESAAAAAVSLTREAPPSLIQNGGFETQGSGDATTADKWTIAAAGTGSVAQRAGSGTPAGVSPYAGSWHFYGAVLAGDAGGGRTAQAYTIAGVSDLTGDQYRASVGVLSIAAYIKSTLTTLPTVTTEGAIVGILAAAYTSGDVQVGYTAYLPIVGAMYQRSLGGLDATTQSTALRMSSLLTDQWVPCSANVKAFLDSVFTKNGGVLASIAKVRFFLRFNGTQIFADAPNSYAVGGALDALSYY